MSSAGGTLGWAADADAVAHVLVDGALDERLTVTGTDGHHLARARRLRTDERVTAGDGQGRWREYRVADVERGMVVLTAESLARDEPVMDPPLACALALTKGEKPETAVTRLTEMGVDRVMLFAARRSVVRWDATRAKSAQQRLERVAREAAMQSRRSRVPRIETAVTLAEVAHHPGVVVADREGHPASALEDPGPGGWLLVVGPEGGFDAGEREALGDAPRLALGPHVLRAETAAIAAAAALTGRREARAPRGSHGG